MTTKSQSYSDSTKVWRKEELKFIKLVKENPVIYTRRRGPSTAPIMKLWKSIAEKTNMSLYECKSKWEYWKKYYVSLRKHELRGDKTPSKFLDGELRFLDNEIDELRQIRKKKTKSIISLNTIDQLLKGRQHDPDIDSATMQYLFDILTDRIEKALKSSKQEKKSVKSSKIANNSEIPKTTKATKIAEPIQIGQISQANTASQIELNSSDNIKKSKLIIKQPEKINMDSIISDIASQELQSTNSQFKKVNVPEFSKLSMLLNEESENELQQEENQTAKLDKDKIDQAESLSNSKKSVDSSQSHAESNTTKSVKSEEIDTVFDLHCSRKDSRLFFKDLAEYIIGNFSSAKQTEIRLKICSIITELELEEME